MPTRKVALVTGSGKRRVGWHVADALASRGYALVIHYHTSASEAAETVAEFGRYGVDVDAMKADLSNESSVRELINQTIVRFGRIDVLVNCAATWNRKKLEDVTAEDVRRHFETNTLSTFLCSQHAGLAMTRQAEGGCIITIGDWAIARPYLDHAAYFPSKGAIPTLTRTLAHELASRNPKVRVNCILPGDVLLPATMPPEARGQAVEATLVRREGSPRDIAKAALALIDNDFLTGVCLPVDGGRTVFAPDAVYRGNL